MALSSISLLRLRGLSVRYGATHALDGVDLDLLPGTVHGLVGENGAGKSTLLRALVGLAGRSAGEAEVLGERGLPSSPAEAEARGVGFAPQELALCNELSVAEQVTLGREPRTRLGTVSRHAQRARARLLLGRVGASLDPDARVGRLRPAERKLVQIARALAAEPHVLLLDEPAAALDAPAAASVARLARAFAHQGRSVLLVSHHVEDVLAQVDVVTVLRDGKLVSTTPASGLDAAELLRRMVGRELPPREATAPPAEGAATACALPPPLALPLRVGEVIGLFGLVGAGRSRLLENLAAQLEGAALVPEERAARGLVPTFTLRENLFLPARFRWLRVARERREAMLWIDRLRIRAAGPDAPIGSLSGGNQQKVLLARALARHPRVLLLDEPTQGVDVGAKAEIHTLVRQLAREGTAILISSSDLPELLALAHRIGVVREGMLAGLLPAASATEHALLALACGVAA
jgi:ABC-type sugar transport system ATPase subunit